MKDIARRIALGIFGGHTPRLGRSSALEIEEVVPLDPRRRLCLVRCGGRRAVLLTGGPNDLLLGWLGGASEPAGPP